VLLCVTASAEHIPEVTTSNHVITETMCLSITGMNLLHYSKFCEIVFLSVKSEGLVNAADLCNQHIDAGTISRLVCRHTVDETVAY
jgi:hypothetical protein